MIFPGQLSESDQEKYIYISLCARNDRMIWNTVTYTKRQHVAQ